jgi:hypothetical protein
MGVERVLKVPCIVPSLSPIEVSRISPIRVANHQARVVNNFQVS